MCKRLLELMKIAGIDGNDLDFIMISHGHEDHDGGLYEISQTLDKKILAHPVYERLIRYYAHTPTNVINPTFPASCWNCPMPKPYSQENCLDYHKERSTLHIEKLVNSFYEIEEGISVHHVPGHSPDSLAVLVDSEALITGDSLLPDITSHPSREDYYCFTEEVLPMIPSNEADRIFGLRAFIRSLKKLKELGSMNPEILVLPAHRLFYNGAWNGIGLRERVDEMIAHHIERCAAIVKILKSGPKTPEEIAREHFEPSLLEGFGISLAVNEILSHCELLKHSHDIRFVEDNRIASTGTVNFESMIDALEPLPDL
jgi:glyoxylase-like metal-dependent hydrolase (beta-lactamase superfamily II)